MIRCRADCEINVEGVAAKVGGAAKKETCQDDDASMQAALRMTCAKMRGKCVCGMFKSYHGLLPKKYCECSCPADAAPTHVSRKLQASGTLTVPTHSMT